MTEAEIREAHAAIVERENCWIRMINNWTRDEKNNQTHCQVATPGPRSLRLVSPIQAGQVHA